MRVTVVLPLCCIIIFLGGSAPVLGSELPPYVETRMGKFPLEIPKLILPELQPLKLPSTPDPVFPELPLWHLVQQLRPPEPGWLDRGGEEVEGTFKKLVSIQSENYREKRENLLRAVRQFAKVASEYPDTHWRIPAEFWGGYAQLQLTNSETKEKLKNAESNKRHLCQKNEDLELVRQRLKKLLGNDSASRYRSQVAVSLVWIPLLERCYEEVLQAFGQYQQMIARRSREHEKSLEFVFYAYLKKGSYNDAVAALQELQTLFPQQHSYLATEASLHYQAQQWEALEKLASRMASRLFNHEETERVLKLVLRSHLERQQWGKARAVLALLGSRGGVSDFGLLGHGEIALQQNYLELAFRSIQAIRDLFLRSKMWKRLVRKAAMKEDYGFLLSLKNESPLQQDPEDHLIYGYALYQGRLHLRAYDTFQQAYVASQDEEDRVQEQALFLRSTIKLRTRDFERARKHLHELLSRFEESRQRSEYYFWLGVLQLEKRKSLRSVRLSMRQVIPDGPRGDERLYVLGFANHEAKEWGRAITTLRQLIDSHPRSPFREEGYYRLADAYYQQGHHQEADQAFSGLREEFQQLNHAVRVIKRQAQNMIKLGRLKEAHALLLKDIPVYPDFQLVSLHLDVLSKLQDDSGMLELTSRAQDYEFTNDQQGLLSYHHANTLFRMMRMDESLSHYLNAQRYPPPNRIRFIQYRIIWIHHILKNHSQVTSLGEKFVKENQSDSKENKVLIWLSDYYEHLGERNRAEPHWRQLAVNYQAAAGQVSLPMEERLGLIVRIGRLYNKLADHKEAERWVDQGLVLNKEMGGDGQRERTLGLLKEKGIAAYELGQHKRALAASLKVSYLDRSMLESEMYELHLRIADSYQQLGRTREAKAIYRKLLLRLKDVQRRSTIQKQLNVLENG